MSRSSTSYSNHNRLIRIASLLSGISLIMSVSFVCAQESREQGNPSSLDEAFLFYLADMSVEDGKVIDQLNMLEVDFDGDQITHKQLDVKLDMRSDAKENEQSAFNETAKNKQKKYLNPDKKEDQ